MYADIFRRHEEAVSSMVPAWTKSSEFHTSQVLQMPSVCLHFCPQACVCSLYIFTHTDVPTCTHTCLPTYIHMRHTRLCRCNLELSRRRKKCAVRRLSGRGVRRAATSASQRLCCRWIRPAQNRCEIFQTCAICLQTSNISLQSLKHKNGEKYRHDTTRSLPPHRHDTTRSLPPQKKCVCWFLYLHAHVCFCDQWSMAWERERERDMFERVSRTQLLMPLRSAYTNTHIHTYTLIVHACGVRAWVRYIDRVYVGVCAGSCGACFWAGRVRGSAWIHIHRVQRCSRVRHTHSFGQDAQGENDIWIGCECQQNSPVLWVCTWPWCICPIQSVSCVL